MSKYDDAVWALADAVWRGLVVPEYAEAELAEAFGFSVAEVSADVADLMHEFECEKRSVSIGR